MAALGHKDVRRLDVAVDDPLVVGGTECVCYLRCPFNGFLDRKWLAGDAMFKRRAFHELHGNKRLAVLLIDLVDGADVGVIQRRSSARLSPKAFESVGNLGEIVRKELERDKPAERSVLSLVHNTHPAATQLFDDPVVRDDFADHCAMDTAVPERTARFEIQLPRR